jgi:hypothetical protein
MAEADRTNNQNEDAMKTSNIGPELAAMTKVSEALNSLADLKARERVISWAASAFGVSALGPTQRVGSETPARPTGNRPADEKEIAGIARVTPNGELHLTVRDLKARSANDAAIRIAHLTLLANERLNNSDSLSSKNVLVPILRRYRAYDGNTRGALAQHRGFARVGDQLSMDLHCKEEAEEFVKQILDPAVQGTWNPSAKPTKKRRSGLQEEDGTSEN